MACFPKSALVVEEYSMGLHAELCPLRYPLGQAQMTLLVSFSKDERRR